MLPALWQLYYFNLFQFLKVIDSSTDSQLWFISAVYLQLCRVQDFNTLIVFIFYKPAPLNSFPSLIYVLPMFMERIPIKYKIILEEACQRQIRKL